MARIANTRTIVQGETWVYDKDATDVHGRSLARPVEVIAHRNTNGQWARGVFGNGKRTS